MGIETPSSGPILSHCHPYVVAFFIMKLVAERKGDNRYHCLLWAKGQLKSYSGGTVDQRQGILKAYAITCIDLVWPGWGIWGLVGGVGF